MKKYKDKILFLVCFFFILSLASGYAQEAGQLYSTAVAEARSGNIHLAFMRFRTILLNYPDSKYAENALFAIGEYYSLIADYPDAIKAFTQYLNEYPDSKANVFVFMYLLKIARIQEKEKAVKDFEKKIITLKQTTFLFRESKEYKYRSPFYRKHRVVYYIDKIECYVDGELFAKISY